jgi:hypothetical protein
MAQFGSEARYRGEGGGVPHGAVQPWGPAPTVGRRPDRILADRGSAAACSVRAREGGDQVARTWGSASSGRGRKE